MACKFGYSKACKSYYFNFHLSSGSKHTKLFYMPDIITASQSTWQHKNQIFYWVPASNFLAGPVWCSEWSIISQSQRRLVWIPHQGTCLGCGFGPRVRAHAGGNRSMFLSLSVSLPSPLSKDK